MLTKTTYTQAITCLKTLWRERHQPNPNPQTDKTTQLRQEAFEMKELKNMLKPELNKNGYNIRNEKNYPYSSR